MNDQQLRRATAADGVACGAILNAWIDATNWMPRTVTPEAIVDALCEGLPKREAYVIGDPVAGYLSLEAEAAHIWGFYVGSPGQGLGQRLLSQAKEGREFLKLNSHHANTRAHGFYAREGFVQVSDPWPGDDGIDEITMEWRA
ncbi:MAG: GNAT family N-acetyltransferase [Sulfitobacter sp.]